eukprot:300291-Rhodomonas_salina.2
MQGTSSSLSPAWGAVFTPSCSPDSSGSSFDTNVHILLVSDAATLYVTEHGRHCLMLSICTGFASTSSPLQSRQYSNPAEFECVCPSNAPTSTKNPCFFPPNTSSHSQRSCPDWLNPCSHSL